jgi:hypothetical protein
MRGREKLTHLDSCTPGMAQALPDLPMDGAAFAHWLLWYGQLF